MKNFIVLILLLTQSTLFSQIIVKPKHLNYPMDSITKQKFNRDLESLFLEIQKDQISEEFITTKNAELTKSQLQELVDYELKKDSSTVQIQDKQLVNIYPISNNKYLFSLAYVDSNTESNPILLYKISLMATKTNEKFTFSIPIDYLTRYWKTKTIGNITYHYRNSLRKKRAKIFNRKNILVAKKFKLEPEKLDFYMCDNFQEISKLLGFDYSKYSNGKYSTGYGVDSKTVFSIMNNEDFSHDMFHYYSGKINKRINRNWIAEEGIAYLWGNAYYTDKNGEMITHKRLVDELKKYLIKYPNTDLLNIFIKNPKIFNDISTQISVRSTISGVIANEIEKKIGLEGIYALINSGRKKPLKNYLRVTNELIGLNKDNFNLKVRTLI